MALIKEDDAAAAGIRHDRANKFVPPGRDSVARTMIKYILFAVPPLVLLLGILLLHCYPLKLAYDNRRFLLSFLPLVGINIEDAVTNGSVTEEVCFGALIVTVFLLAASVHAVSYLTSEKKEFPPTGPKKVCILGAGISGIVTAKECLEAGHDVTVLEKTEAQGGVWRHRAWTKTMLTSSNMNTSLSDFIFPEVFLENEHVGFATRDQFVTYLDSYAKHFHVKEVIQFGCTVVDVLQEGKSYSVTWKKGGSEHTQAFDYVAVCTGLPNTPRPCTIENHENFEGVITHSKTYVDAKPFQGKRVLVVGTGESASDIVQEVAQVSSQPVGISQHSPVLVLDRDHYESPPDYAENRLLHLCPAIARYAYLKMLFFYIVAFGSWTTRFHDMPKSFTWLNFLFFYKLPVDTQQPTAACSIIHITKSGSMLQPISDGKAVQLKAATKCLGGKTIEFEDGSRAEYDCIILANGYTPSKLPFLKSLNLSESKDSERYHLTFDPNHPKVAFIGYTRGQVGAVTTLMEMQARWFALLVSGARKLPSPGPMRRRINTVKSLVRGKYMTRTSWFTANYLARHEVLCEPNLLTLAFAHPSLVYKILTRSFASWQFRLNGPGAKPELALEAYESCQLATNIPGERLHRAVMATLVVTSHLWWFVLSALPLPNALVVGLNGAFMPNTSEAF